MSSLLMYTSLCKFYFYYILLQSRFWFALTMLECSRWKA